MSYLSTDPTLPPTAASPLTAHEPARVLVVDDDPAIRKAVSLLLVDEGYAVQTAANGTEGLAAITAQPPALVLLDLNMPVMDGWALLGHLRDAQITVPIVIMTADQRAPQEAARLQVAGYLGKPFAIDDLLDLVARLAG
jgi:two-component system, OmpR family, response regulator MprA